MELCNAGRNYLYVAHDGRIARCTCRQGVLDEWIGHISDFRPPADPASPCELLRKCEAGYLGDWNRSSRLEGETLRKGEFAADARSLVTKLNLTGRCNFRCFYCHPERLQARAEDEREAKEWSAFLRRIHGHYVRCWHHVQGTIGEPLLYPGLVEVCKTIFELGDHLHLITNLSVHHERLEGVLRAGHPSVLRFGASWHASDKRFSQQVFDRGLQMIADAGYYVEVLVVGVPTQLWLYGDLVEKYRSMGIAVRLFYASMQPTTPVSRQEFSRLMSGSQSGKTVY